MITKDFPITVPKLFGASGLHPKLIKKLMPKPDHFSGTTPRWKQGRELPIKKAIALILPPGEKVPITKAADAVTPADIPNVVAWIPCGESVDELRRDYMRHYWESTKGRERAWITNRAKEMGGWY